MSLGEYVSRSLLISSELWHSSVGIARRAVTVLLPSAGSEQAPLFYSWHSQFLSLCLISDWSHKRVTHFINLPHCLAFVFIALLFVYFLFHLFYFYIPYFLLSASFELRFNLLLVLLASWVGWRGELQTHCKLCSNFVLCGDMGRIIRKQFYSFSRVSKWVSAMMLGPVREKGQPLSELGKELLA